MGKKINLCNRLRICLIRLKFDIFMTLVYFNIYGKDPIWR
jgi:hypothetical protein